MGLSGLERIWRKSAAPSKKLKEALAPSAWRKRPHTKLCDCNAHFASSRRTVLALGRAYKVS
jgi:hypothetical protein